MSRETKCTSLLSEIIGAVSFESIITKLKTHSFSIILDESIDRSNIKHLVMVVRIVKDTFLIGDHFVTLIEVTSASSQDFCIYVIKCFPDNKVPYKTNRTL